MTEQKAKKVQMVEYRAIDNKGRLIKFSIPSTWKITYGQMNPKFDRNPQSSGYIRIYEAQTKQRAVIPNIKTFWACGGVDFKINFGETLAGRLQAAEEASDMIAQIAMDEESESQVEEIEKQLEVIRNATTKNVVEQTGQAYVSSFHPSIVDAIKNAQDDDDIPF